MSEASNPSYINMNPFTILRRPLTGLLNFPEGSEEREESKS